MVSSASPLPPSLLGDASEPTQRPISIGQSPSRRRPCSSTFFGIGAHQFERAHDAGSASELIEREQAQRVAHDDGDAGAEHARVRQPPMRDHEGREAEIGFRLAAAGREEQEVGNLSVRMLAIRPARRY